MRVYTEGDVRAAIFLGVLIGIVAVWLFRCLMELLGIVLDKAAEAWVKRRIAARSAPTRETPTPADK